MREISDLERNLVLETIKGKYGYDFHGYAPSSFDRRIRAIIGKYDLMDCAELIARLLRQPEFFQSILPHLTIGTTEMFRDGGFFRALREEIFPHLRTYPSLNLWVAGCSTGQEAYSLAILLKEEGLYDRSVIFATDINPVSLTHAREGIFPAEAVPVYTRNYLESGGRQTFSDYYMADYGYIRMSGELKDNLVFSEHNLVVDGVFTEAHLILCRNVLIYFDRELQNHVLALMQNTLRYKGFLCLGSKENLRFTSAAAAFNVIDAKHKIYQKHGRLSA
ncbi:MAG: protein-glutamate O-methyltransferase CheR [Bdellovibrionales bacterium]